MRRLLLLAALGAAAAGVACSDLGPGGDDLLGDVADQRRAWESWRPQAYVYEVERLCFCGVEARGPVRVHVVAERVVAQEYVDGGGALAQDASTWFPDVDGLFDILEDAVRRDAHQVQVTWDPVSGAPLDFWIDYDVNVADEELGYRIVGAPRTAP